MDILEAYLREQIDEELFLLQVLFQLTIAFRCIQSESQTENGYQKLKQINEINHRILSRINALKVGSDYPSRESLVRQISNHINNVPDISCLIRHSWEQALAKLRT